ncbi:MAG: tyrosine-protein phosphatase [Gammaproteobacteria bacterium]|nr:tyrosine-protein phosphatase [Gammaproteobacteria bacterium]MCK5499346.1 tyrosine-protein phosphatase [Gammaproteobacteria bacterium]
MRCFFALLLAAVFIPLTSHANDYSFTRQIPLEGQHNFRDIGGYKTVDGQTVKRGQIYRSGELGRLTDEDVERLASLKIKTVVSFLIPPEIEARGMDRVPAGVKEISLPMEAGNMGDLTVVVNEARDTGDFSKISPDINPEIHRLLMIEAKDYYASLLREIAKPDSKPLVYHCSHGVHRTGTATAILLSALGVPWETVREDYLLSNTYRKAEVDKRLAALRLLAAETLNIKPEQVDVTNMNAFYILHDTYIDASLDEAVKSYGSMDNYIREGLGISSKELTALRTQLLESARE